MIRFIILVIVALAIFWGYNNFNPSKFVDDTKAGASNAKIIKTVGDRRAMDYEAAENVGE